MAQRTPRRQQRSGHGHHGALGVDIPILIHLTTGIRASIAREHRAV